MLRLVVEDATEMIDIGKDFILQGQKRPARIDEIQAGQIILFGDLLGAQMLLDRHREIRPAFDSGIVGDDQHFAIGDTSDARDDARAWTFVIIKVSTLRARRVPGTASQGRAGVRSVHGRRACPALPVACDISRRHPHGRAPGVL